MNFWNDVWLRQLGPLRCFFARPGQPDETLKVCDMIDVFVRWDWTRLNLLLLNHVLLQIATRLPHCLDAGADRLAWKWLASDFFSSVETYKNLATLRVSIDP